MSEHHRQPRCWPVDRWPAPDRAAWAAALTPGDPFEPGGVAAGWAPISRRVIAQGYGNWLRWLDEQGLLDPLLPPAARVSKDRVVAYLAELRASVSPFTVQSLQCVAVPVHELPINGIALAALGGGYIPVGDMAVITGEKHSSG